MDFQTISNLSGLTPLMKQYVKLKKEYDTSLLLFQVGDFYELFFDDAKKASEYLGITLTKRGEINGHPIPLCGFPMHAVDHYLEKLVKGGFTVALCDQLEPATTGKMVARGVTNVLTPGTLTSDNLLDAKSSSFLFSFFPTKAGYGLLFSELLTSQLHGTFLPFGADRSLETELFRFLPDEVLLLDDKAVKKYRSFFTQRGFFTTLYGSTFDQQLIKQEQSWVQQQFDQATVSDISDKPALLYALILWKKYLQKNQNNAFELFSSVNLYNPEQFLMLDGATQKNLDLVKNSFDGSKSHTLFSHVDKAVTPMGSRMIKRWLLRPLMDQTEIMKRQQVVQTLIDTPVLLSKLQDLLQQCGDMQRVVGRIALDKALLQDYVQLGKLLSCIPDLKVMLGSTAAVLLMELVANLVDFTQLEKLLRIAFDDSGEGTIKHGFDVELDRMKDLVANSNQKILQLEQNEQQRTGIGSLKVRHNNVHGYYIEVTNANLDAVPEDYIEQQKLVNRKRFTTKALRSLQFEIMQASKSVHRLEKEIFDQVKQQVRGYVHDLRSAAQALATVDALVGFARLAYEYGYSCPEFNDDRNILIKQGKHPIVSSTTAQPFIANDTQLTDEQSLWVVTGPNMGGKSTYLRQVALICLLAQTGSFVPAHHANVSILDRIFTRIGAGDHLAEGKSTFLVEMEETAQICLQATERSLVILDEVGRGTSTYDGLALAQAVVEYVFNQVKARCLFATHYHELTDLQHHYEGIVSYYMDSQKTASGIIFLHTLVRGVADGSFGIEVAKLARLPRPLVTRAQDILHQLHQELPSEQRKAIAVKLSQVDRQDLPFDQHEVIEKLLSIDINDLSPKQAFDLIWEMKQMLKVDTRE